jgi:hypothetical protein
MRADRGHEQLRRVAELVLGDVQDPRGAGKAVPLRSRIDAQIRQPLEHSHAGPLAPDYTIAALPGPSARPSDKRDYVN